MALTNEELRQQLQEAFLEIAFRANRLREWVDLNRDLDNLKRSFDDFSVEVNRVMKNGGVGDSQLLFERWARCSDTDLLDLENACDNFQYISRVARGEPPAAAAGAAPGEAALLTKVSLEALFDLKKKIQKDLDDASFKQLQQRCLVFDQTLKKEVSRYKQSVKQELINLCNMTAQVRMQL